MALQLLFISLIVLLILGVPIAFSLFISSLVYLLIQGNFLFTLSPKR